MGDQSSDYKMRAKKKQKESDCSPVSDTRMQAVQSGSCTRRKHPGY